MSIRNKWLVFNNTSIDSKIRFVFICLVFYSCNKTVVEVQLGLIIGNRRDVSRSIESDLDL